MRVDLPEALFDMDHPGHYMRRIKTVALTIPCVASPYASVNAKLTLLRDTTRVRPSLGGGYARAEEGDDPRFVDNWASTSAIVTSRAQEDSGLFELRLDDERYLPFEGAGAISRWRIELPDDTNAFDIAEISDAMLHLAYTAQEGGETLAEAARPTASRAPTIRAASIERLDERFPGPWRQLVSPPPPGTDQAMVFELDRARLPYLHQKRNVSIVSVVVLAHDAAGPLEGTLTAPGEVAASVTMTPQADLEDRIVGTTQNAFAAGVPLGTWQLKLRRKSAVDSRSLTPADVAGLTTIFVYDASASDS